MWKTGTYEGDPRSQLRHDPVQKRWVIVASERGHRPVEFQRPTLADGNGRDCPFCAGREGLTPPSIAQYPYNAAHNGWRVRVVPNKFPALRVEGDLERTAAGPYDMVSGVGAHEVVIETPDHAARLAELSVEQIALVLRVYRDRLVDLRKDTRFRYILVFKNSGAAAGASLAHSHSQIMATPITPRTVAMELVSAQEHYRLKERCIFCDLLEFEHQSGERMVWMDQFFATYCPYASRFPFEMQLYPRRHSHDFALQDDDLLLKLAHHLKEVLRRMNRALDNPPYNFLLHTCPSVLSKSTRARWWETLEADWHWHLEILPRLTNVAGFEWGTGFYINPTAPEVAARYLRQVDL
ncbi:MAG: DUF4931 domain-containing protein [Deltaproteobacteria bacterium]|nr:DUF4931 domain-containing protein [Deltaproteobacteria bacterium]